MTLDQIMTENGPPTLQQTLRFRPEDLEANRTGQLSDLQTYQLRVSRRRSMLIGLGMALVFAFIASLFIYSSRNGSQILLLIGIGVTLCNAALLGVFGRHWVRLSADIRRGQVVTHTGPLERIIKPMTRRVFNYVIRVEDAELFVPKETFEAFEHEQVYTLYRAPHTGTLLSAEKQT